MIVWSCDSNTKPRVQKIDAYYDIEGLIDEQMSWLDSVGPSLYKTGTIKGRQAVEQFQPSDSVWRQELLAFRLIDINRPILADSYNASETETDLGSTLTYTSRNTRTTLVDSIYLEFDQQKNPLLIHAFLHSRNPLFVSEKRLEMHFEIVKNKPAISEYRVSGSQKMIMFDRVHFEIDSRIIMP